MCVCVSVYTQHILDWINDCYHWCCLNFYRMDSIWFHLKICWFSYHLMHVHNVHVQYKCFGYNKDFNLNRWQMNIFSFHLKTRFIPDINLLLFIQIKTRRDSRIMRALDIYLFRTVMAKRVWVHGNLSVWVWATPKSIQSKQNATIARNTERSFFVIQLMCLKSIGISIFLFTRTWTNGTTHRELFYI